MASTIGPLDDVDRHRGPGRRTGEAGASLWMVGITLLLFFLPCINGVIGGLVGGYKVQGAHRAFMTAILPAAVVGLVLWLLDAPVLGFASGVPRFGLMVISSAGILLGALIGGAASSRRARRRPSGHVRK